MIDTTIKCTIFEAENLNLHYMDTDSFVIPFKQIKCSIEDLKQIKEE